MMYHRQHDIVYDICHPCCLSTGTLPWRCAVRYSIQWTILNSYLSSIEDLKYAHLPAECLVLNAWPGSKSVAFISTQVWAAVGAGAKLARAN